MINNMLKKLCLVAVVLSAQVSANTVYLVRHGEKLPDGADPALNACGESRAKALAQYFADIELAAVYATPYQRTQQTAVAVAHSQQLKVSLYNPHEPDILQQQLQLQTQPVLVVGHSNTIPQLVTQLSGFELAALNELEYGMLYQVDFEPQISVTLRRQQFDCNVGD